MRERQTEMLLALAVLLPPHARVNHQCHPVWNDARTNLDVVWHGRAYRTPWTFNVEVTGDSVTCLADACVQRLWCTDSGAVGRYTVDTRQADCAVNSVLDYAWLLNATARGRRVLAVQGTEGDSTLMTYTSCYGHGTVLVLGSTLFFYTHDWQGRPVTYGLPRLSALRFAPYVYGTPADALVSQPLTAFNVLGYAAPHRWDSLQAPLYPAGAEALTLSVDEYGTGRDLAVDVALALSGDAPRRAAMVHYLLADTPSLATASREVLTVPGFSCRAFANGTAPRCFKIGSAATKYTWASAAQTAFGWTFAPMAGLASFALPAALWLHDVATKSGAFRVLAAHGLGSLLAFDGAAFHGVEQRPEPACNGSALVLVSYDVGDALVQRSVSAPIACARAQRFPRSWALEAPFEAAHVKWLGPSAGHYTLFAATDIAAHEYAALESTPTCPAGEWRESALCVPCPAGHFCPGVLDDTDEKRVCPRFSHAAQQGMAKCAVAAGRYFAYPGSVELCPADAFCPGGLSDPIACPASRPRCGRGCWQDAQCHA